ncbi:MAG: hypothetical protein LBK06_00260 [Planctomycetaceae bacterium]|nr:hypothetical protein [Planctomycetaceae bacterium]
MNGYTEAGKAIGFALEQPLHVVALPCSALRILKRLQHTIIFDSRIIIYLLTILQSCSIASFPPP